MQITITRSDQLANVGTESHAPGEISRETFADWDSAFASLRARNIPVTAAHESTFRAQPETFFRWPEFVNLGHTVYHATVDYAVRVS